MAWKHRVICLDYDGTLVEDVHPRRDGRATAGAAEFTQGLRKDGWEILVSTCRPSFERKDIEANLRQQGIEFDHISFYGKPSASLYVDDKGVRFEGDWTAIREWMNKQ